MIWPLCSHQPMAGTTPLGRPSSPPGGANGAKGQTKVAQPNAKGLAPTQPTVGPQAEKLNAPSERDVCFYGARFAASALYGLRATLSWVLSVLGYPDANVLRRRLHDASEKIDAAYGAVQQDLAEIGSMSQFLVRVRNAVKPLEKSIRDGLNCWPLKFTVFRPADKEDLLQMLSALERKKQDLDLKVYERTKNQWVEDVWETLQDVALGNVSTDEMALLHTRLVRAVNEACVLGDRSEDREIRQEILAEIERCFS